MSRTTANWTTVSFFALFIIVNLIGAWLMTASNGVGPLDSRMSFGLDYLSRTLDAYSDTSIQIYQYLFLPVDFLYIAGTIIAGTIAARRTFRGNGLNILVPIVIIVGITDTIENLLIYGLLGAHEMISDFQYLSLNTFTAIKGLGMIAFVVIVIYRVIRNRISRKA